ncbi:XRE family transcriptional regulator [Nocardiopsis aegyptia]|uniref:Transcriptional regulator with XRE-family HTH domain n=1 Tax=Nocardiopsis aegyptia TaxID=220378 RepID=A0A7Z0EPC1_9ACTN|nr:XRE family transcriptional regulator [Nocardiopsis aegyptia]NYJ34885.1 transcriptional regulator with XRE-family HTH domain [Nocardiopsis aegyptia]
MNAALRKALAASQLTETDVAAHIGVDPKTVRRWLAGQRPYPRHRWAVAELLQVEEDSLWPENSQAQEENTPLSEHACRVYAHRWEVPREVWYELFSSAEQEIGILVYSSLFLADDAGILELLEARAREGVNIRILLGDPGAQEVRQRGNDEEIGDALPARARNALMLFRPLLDIDGVDVRTHSTVLYNSVYLTDKRILVNQHVYGLPAAKSPVVEIDRSLSPDMAETYVQSFELAWQTAKRIITQNLPSIARTLNKSESSITDPGNYVDPPI